MNPKYSDLFQPFQFSNGIELKNRIVMAPMTNFLSHDDGTVSDKEISYYIRRLSGVKIPELRWLIR
ncbi:hypothetical protein [Mesobacillus zeae]|uniref:oxidoreductase n=1 Tax=Mesobacillus zeae TaxID=1917180 RepID=UPI0026C95407